MVKSSYARTIDSAVTISVKSCWPSLLRKDLARNATYHFRERSHENGMFCKGNIHMSLHVDLHSFPKSNSWCHHETF